MAAVIPAIPLPVPLVQYWPNDVCYYRDTFQPWLRGVRIREGRERGREEERGKGEEEAVHPHKFQESAYGSEYGRVKHARVQVHGVLSGNGAGDPISASWLTLRHVTDH